jgi:hypothetical protein
VVNNWKKKKCTLIVPIEYQVIENQSKSLFVLESRGNKYEVGKKV